MPLVNCCRAAGDTVSAIRHLTRMLDTMDAVCGLPTVEVGSCCKITSSTVAELLLSAPLSYKTLCAVGSDATAFPPTLEIRCSFFHGHLLVGGVRAPVPLSERWVLFNPLWALSPMPHVHAQVGNLHDLLGELHADRASSAPAALRARAKKQVCTGASEKSVSPASRNECIFSPPGLCSLQVVMACTHAGLAWTKELSIALGS